MNKILLALGILSAGASGFLTTRQSANQLQRQAEAVREAWLTQTQQVAAALSEQAALIQHVQQLKQTPEPLPVEPESELWAALATNRADHLPPALRERVFEELELNWRSSSDFVWVTKQTLRELNLRAVTDGKLSEVAGTVYALSPEERVQVEWALQQVPTYFREWVVARVERIEPKDDVLAHYTLPLDPTFSVTNKVATALANAVGRDRGELILRAVRQSMWELNLGRKPSSLIVRREQSGGESRLKLEAWDMKFAGYTGFLPDCRFPEAFRPLFSNGWADLAVREGFELPPEPPKN